MLTVARVDKAFTKKVPPARVSLSQPLQANLSSRVLPSVLSALEPLLASQALYVRVCGTSKDAATGARLTPSRSYYR
jgi:hypothetical protein